MNPLNKTNSSINGESFGHLSNQSGPKKEEHVCMNVEKIKKRKLNKKAAPFELRM